jgi:hypothetical protein
VPARGRRDHEQCGRASGGGTGCVGSRKRASVAAVAELPAAPVLPRVGEYLWGGVCASAR